MTSAPLSPLPPPHTRVGVGGVLIRNGRVLVNRAVYRSRFTIPSGYVDPGEGVETALVREFEEETGLRITVGPLLITRHKVIAAAESDVYFGFLVESASGTAEPRPPEIAELREPTVDEAIVAPWISELSRLTIRIATGPESGWARSDWSGGEVPGLRFEAFHPGPNAPKAP
jgi:8-oxo-dGTP diphosphatase